MVSAWGVKILTPTQQDTKRKQQNQLRRESRELYVMVNKSRLFCPSDTQVFSIPTQPVQWGTTPLTHNEMQSLSLYSLLIKLNPKKVASFHLTSLED